jgi:hypothetical protein
MIEVQEVVERTNSPTFFWRSINKGNFSIYIYMGVFFTHSAFDIILAMIFVPKPPWTVWQTPTDHRWSVGHSLKKDYFEFMKIII